MKIGLNATCLNKRPSGAKQRFVGLYNALFKRMPDAEFVIYQTSDSDLREYFSMHNNVVFVEAPIPDGGRLRKYLAGLRFWRKEFSKRQFDIFEGYHLPFTASPTGKNLLTMHDIRGVSAYSGFFERLKFGSVLASAFKRADHVITVSEAMHADILAFSPGQAVSVIYNGIVADDFVTINSENQARAKAKIGFPDGFLLTVGHFEKRKNYARLIDALAGLHARGQRLNLVMVGNDSGDMLAIRQQIAARGLLAHVVILSGISDNSVRSLYQLAGLFVFPSYYEGFGIPILEAMAAGCPMALSDTPVFREITGGQGLFFPPNDVPAMIQAIETGLQSEPERQRQIQWHKQRVKDFDFDGIATGLEALYHRLSLAPAGKVHAAFMIKALGHTGGGAERVLVDVANGLAERGHVISVITCDAPGTPSYYPLHASIERVQLNSGNTSQASGLRQFYKRLQSYRRVLKARQPDVAIAFMHSSYLPAGLALLGTGIPLIASEHIGPEHYKSRPLERLLLQAIPLLAASITVVSEQIRASFSPWLRRKMRVAHNPVSFTAKPRMAACNPVQSRSKILLTVGRMTEQKNQACLIEAFAQIAEKFPSWVLRIAGDGPLQADLQAQIARLGLGSRVQLPGNISDIGAEYEKADLFVLPSRYESFGLATAEAIMHGLPAVGFAGCPGTNVLIRPGENGVLAKGNGDADALALVLAELMGDPQALKCLENAPTQWLQDAYSLTHVLDNWEQLLEPFAGRRQNR